MQYLAYIIIGVIGIWLGRHFATKRYTGGWGMRDLQQKAIEAREEKFEDIERKILNFVKENGRITNNDVEAIFDVSDATARRYLDNLEKDDKLKQIGGVGRNVHYTLLK